MSSSPSWLTVSLLCLFGLIQSGLTYPPIERLILHPLTVRKDHKSLEPRSHHGTTFPKLDLQSQGQLIYGGSPGSVLLFLKTAQRGRGD